MNPKFKLTPSQINAIKNSPKGVLPAFLGKTIAKGATMPGAIGKAVGGAVGRALGKRR